MPAMPGVLGKLIPGKMVIMQQLSKMTDQEAINLYNFMCATTIGLDREVKAELQRDINERSGQSA